MKNSTQVPFQRMLIHSKFIIEILKLLPGADPSWGVVRKGASQFLQEIREGILKDEGQKIASQWDERHLADQWSSLL